MDFSNCQMTDLKWIEEYKEQLGKDRFDRSLNIIYGWLMELKPGQSLNLYNHGKITERNRDLVIKICSLFISEGNCEYQFSNDYSQIKNNCYVPKYGSKKKDQNMDRQRNKIPL